MVLLTRAVAYLAGTRLAAYLTGQVGIAYYEETDCAGGEGDCLAVLGGLVWGMIAVPVCLLVVLAVELALWRRRKAARALNRPV